MAAGVGTMVGFGEAECGDGLATHDRRDEAGLLVSSRVLHQDLGDQGRVVEQVAHVEVGAAHLLTHHAGGHAVGGLAPECLGGTEAEQADVGGSSNDAVRRSSPVGRGAGTAAAAVSRRTGGPPRRSRPSREAAVDRSSDGEPSVDHVSRTRHERRVRPEHVDDLRSDLVGSGDPAHRDVPKERFRMPFRRGADTRCRSGCDLVQPCSLESRVGPTRWRAPRVNATSAPLLAAYAAVFDTPTKAECGAHDHDRPAAFAVDQMPAGGTQQSERSADVGVRAPRTTRRRSRLRIAGVVRSVRGVAHDTVNLPNCSSAALMTCAGTSRSQK